MNEHRKLLHSTSTIGILTILSRVLGYLRDSRIAFLLGTVDLADAFTVAYRIPNLLRRLAGEGVMSAAFIPLFSRYLMEKNEKDAWEFANTLLTALVAFLTIVTIGGMFLAPYIVPLFAYGFGVTPGKLETTTLLSRIIFP